MICRGFEPALYGVRDRRPHQQTYRPWRGARVRVRPRARLSDYLPMVRATGIEPAQAGVSSRCSSFEHHAHLRAGDGNRTQPTTAWKAATSPVGLTRARVLRWTRTSLSLLNRQPYSPEILGVQTIEPPVGIEPTRSDYETKPRPAQPGASHEQAMGIEPTEVELATRPRTLRHLQISPSTQRRRLIVHASAVMRRARGSERRACRRAGGSRTRPLPDPKSGVAPRDYSSMAPRYKPRDNGVVGLLGVEPRPLG